MDQFARRLAALIPATALLALCSGCAGQATKATFPDTITVSGIAQNPEGIEYDGESEGFFLSSLNAGPVIRVGQDGAYAAFTSGEAFPLSTAGLQIDRQRNRLLAAGFNGTELLDDDPATRGVSFLRIYDLTTGAAQQDINLSSLAPDAAAYFANDLAVDNDGNVYISDWYAGIIYKVDTAGAASVFWTNQSVVPGGPNGLDFHPDGYLLVSVINDPTYSKFALVKIPLDNPAAAANVAVSGVGFSGFDGMVITPSSKVVGVTNDGKSPGGNVLLKLSSDDDWASASVVTQVSIPASTTVAVTPGEQLFVINQDFSDGMATSWKIQKVVLP